MTNLNATHTNVINETQKEIKSRYQLASYNKDGKTYFCTLLATYNTEKESWNYLVKYVTKDEAKVNDVVEAGIYNQLYTVIWQA